MVTNEFKTVVWLVLFMGVFTSCNSQEIKHNDMKLNKLNREEERVILKKGTEFPFTGIFTDHFERGTYLCKQCDAPLYRSETKFHSGCGWPSFDDEIEGAVKRVPDADGRRTEIVCAHCGGHLGHVFEGEGFTSKNTRHCVNSISMKFLADTVLDTAYFASGCFWGVQYHFNKAKGVISTQVGYSGGHKHHPTYEEVCTGRTGHAETVEVIYNPSLVSFEELTKLFFETHDFTQVNRQGPDIGTQYRSEIFYVNDQQKAVADKLSDQLTSLGYKVATKFTPFEKFWIAEKYHHNYYEKKGGSPYCHIYRKIF